MWEKVVNLPLLNHDVRFNQNIISVVLVYLFPSAAPAAEESPAGDSPSLLSGERFP